MDQFTLHHPVDGQVVLTCTGDLDLLTRVAFGAACHDAIVADHRKLVVDLDAVDFIDCGSVRLLAHAAYLQTSQGGDFLVVCSSDLVRRVLDLTGFSAHHAVLAAPGAARAGRRRQVSSRARAQPFARRAAR